MIGKIYGEEAAAEEFITYFEDKKKLSEMEAVYYLLMTSSAEQMNFTNKKEAEAFIDTERANKILAWLCGY